MERQPASLSQEEGHHSSHQQYPEERGISPGVRIYDDLAALPDMKRPAMGVKRDLLVGGCLSTCPRYGSETDHDVWIRAPRRQAPQFHLGMNCQPEAGIAKHVDQARNSEN
jgi:hypothetical protein